ncbi:TRAP transporter small permease [Piscinibacter sp.]|uniref:TRAP transporter small permease n=1 Tax=Piscinibacter sp. TaxID=1903157 RepID=UPI002B9451D9|nr:TRAP transporter small permease [Albitalea sp.]HUG26397.1 TRAP transporter small permease [Albitalea sp.]
MPIILRRLAVLFAIAGCLSACLVAALVVVSIAGRSLMSAPIQGDVELTQFGIALAIALCLPWAQLHGSNIIVDFFTQRAGERTLRRLDAFGSLLLALMTGVLAWRTAVGAISVRDSFETTMILGLPMWITYAVLAPGLALTALIALVQMKLHLAGEQATA